MTAWRPHRSSAARLPEGPQYYPDDMVTDVPDPFWRELVREQLLAEAAELPHSIATRVVEGRPRIRREILVERVAEGDGDRSQGREPRELASLFAVSCPRVPMSNFVKVEKNWQRRPDSVANWVPILARFGSRGVRLYCSA